MSGFEIRLRRYRAIVFLILFSLISSFAFAEKKTDPVLQWNLVTIDTLRRAADTGPGFPSRSMAIVHAAIYDTVNAIKPNAEPYLFQQEAPRSTRLDTAIAGAAYTALAALYPAQKNILTATLVQMLSPNSHGRFGGDENKIFDDSSFLFGVEVAEVILASRQNDGAEIEVPYNPSPVPGVWLPTFPDFTPAWGTTWGQLRLFTIQSRTSYLPPPPPALSSVEYANNVNEVKSLGRFSGSTRTPEQTLIALFWSYDIPADGSPITLYNEVLQVVARQEKNSTMENARLFAMANFAMADAGIVAWLAKFQYILWRPIQALRRANEDANPLTVQDPNWAPLGVATSPFTGSMITPPFPAYVSGHSTFGAATFETLRQFYGKDSVRFTLTSRDTPGVNRTYPNFTAAELENGRSRIYMGVHYTFDNVNGIALGRNVAQEVFSNFPLRKEDRDF